MDDEDAVVELERNDLKFSVAGVPPDPRKRALIRVGVLHRFRAAVRHDLVDVTLADLVFAGAAAEPDLLQLIIPDERGLRKTLLTCEPRAADFASGCVARTGALGCLARGLVLALDCAGQLGRCLCHFAERGRNHRRI